ncbi:MAG: tetratricopeptide repeat protein [Pseudomonadota bacterium]
MDRFLPRCSPALLTAALLLGGCTTQKGLPGPAEPVGGAPPIYPTIEQRAPGAGAATPGAPRSDASQATLALLDRSRRAASAGDRSNAIAYVERALRLEPKDPRLWLELARLQLPQAPTAAERYARKALALAPRDAILERDAWLLIAEAKAEAGDAAGAATIRQRYRTFRG